MATPPMQSIPGGRWTDPDTGTIYAQNAIGAWYPISSNVQRSAPVAQAAPSVQGTGSSIQDLLSPLLGSTSSVIQPNYPAGSFIPTPFKQFYDKAYEELAPYYKQLLSESGGDLDIALTNLERDYKSGKRITGEDFEKNMETLGVTLPQEQTQLQGNLNKRGVALTENPQGQTQYAGGGLAKSSVDTLNQDQKLRAEAIKRTQQRGIETVVNKKLIGSEQAQQSYRDITEKQQAEHESKASSLGQQYQSADLASKQAGIDAAERSAQYGTGGKKNVNPNDAGSIKSAYPGYASWNDLQSVINDYAATGGAGKE